MQLTVGPLPPAVYWRRRAVVLGGLLLVLFLIVQACNASSASPRDDAAAGATPTVDAIGATPQPTATARTPSVGSPQPTVARTQGALSPTNGGGAPSPAPAAPLPGGSAAAGEACTDAEIRVTAVSQQTEFQRGQFMRFTIKIKNISDRTCTRDVGADLQELRLVEGTGATKVWSSDDCGALQGNDEQSFTPGFERAYWTDWNGKASTACSGGNPDLPDGPVPEHGTYQLIGRLGKVYSEPLTITLR